MDAKNNGGSSGVLLQRRRRDPMSATIEMLDDVVTPLKIGVFVVGGAVSCLPTALQEWAAFCRPYRLALLSRRARAGCVVPGCSCHTLELTIAETRKQRDQILARVDPAQRCAKLEHVLDELLVRCRSRWQISDISFDTSWLWLTAYNLRTGEQMLIPIDLRRREGPVEQNEVRVTFKPRPNRFHNIKHFAISARCGRSLYTWAVNRNDFVCDDHEYDLKKPSREWSEQNFGEFFYYRDGAFHLDVSKL